MLDDPALPKGEEKNKKKVVQLEELPKAQIKMYVLIPGYLQVGNFTGKTTGFWGAAFQEKRIIPLSFMKACISYVGGHTPLCGKSSVPIG